MTATRTLRELVDQGKGKLAPLPAELDILKAIDRSGELVTAEVVDFREAGESLHIWEVIFRRDNGERYTMSWWPNVKVDDTLTTIMQGLQEGEVGGVRIWNAGTDKKPFWLVGAA